MRFWNYRGLPIIPPDFCHEGIRGTVFQLLRHLGQKSVDFLRHYKLDFAYENITRLFAIFRIIHWLVGNIFF